METKLKQFVRLVDAGSFVRAAQELHISQPALSVAIAKLERDLRAPLLVRGARPIALTAAGKLAYAAGKDVLLTGGNLRTQLSELSSQQPSVSLGMIDSVANALLGAPQIIDELEQQASLSLVIDNSRNLQRATLDTQLDQAFVVAQEQFPPPLDYSPVGVETLVMVCHPARHAALTRALRGGSLPRFISYDQASTTRRLVLEELEQHNVVIDTTLYSTSPDVMLRLTLLQKGAAALPYLMVRDSIADGKLSVLAAKKPLQIERRICAIKRRGVVLPTVLGQCEQRLGYLLGAVHAEAQQMLS